MSITLPLLVSGQIANAAPDADIQVGEITGLILLLVKATKQHNWAILAGVLLMLCVWGLRSFAKQVPKAWLPLITLLLAGIPGLAMALMQPAGIDTNQAIAALISIWLMASGSWSAIVEPIRQLLKSRANQETPSG